MLIRTTLFGLIFCALLLDITLAAAPRPRNQNNKNVKTTRKPKRGKPAQKYNSPVKNKIKPKSAGNKKPGNGKKKPIPGPTPYGIAYSAPMPISPQGPSEPAVIVPSGPVAVPVENNLSSRIVSPDYGAGIIEYPSYPDTEYDFGNSNPTPESWDSKPAKKKVTKKQGTYKSRSRHSNSDSFEEDYEYTKTKQE